MMRIGMYPFLSGLLLLLLSVPANLRAETTNEPPDFKEVYELVRDHLGGVSEADLNRAAVKGLVTALAPKVELVTNGPSEETSVSSQPVLKTGLFDGDIAYVRIGRVAEWLPQAIHSAYDALGATNKLKGLVLDLRYTGGDDYSAAASVADLFLKKEQPLLNWGNGVIRSTEKTDALTLPVAVLVNRRTKEAAEALAAVMRQAGIGLILGGKTAGQAMVAREFPLKNGDKLKIATARIEVGETVLLSPEGVKPDILVEVRPEDERAYYEDAFKVIERGNQTAGAGTVTNQVATTNRIRRPRFNEAELVRERREGANLDQDLADEKEEPEKPTVRDPALARALDLLKGLAVVRHSTS
jgi:C-terminal processing protease CtpA/Prc